MNGRKTLYGYCPEQGCQYSVQIGPAEAGSSDHVTCQHYLEHSCPTCGADISNCPLVKSAQ